MIRSVDGPAGPGYAGRAALVLLLAGLAGCASATGGARSAGPPQPDLAAAAMAATAPRRAVQATFAWQLQDKSARFNGRGVVRMEAPYRARIDLFGPRGETVLSAAAVGDDLRLPPGAKADRLPPVPLLWSALGVLRPPAGATLTGTRVDSAGETLDYTENGDHWRFEIEHGRLTRATWDPHGGGRHSVRIEAGRPLPAKADYRDWIAFRELVLTLEHVKNVAGFPAQIWSPGRF